MAIADPSKSQRTLTLTIRPFGGRNSDTDALTLADNQASDGQNFRTIKGVLRRRRSFSRIGINMSLPGGNTNHIHAFAQLHTGSSQIIRVVGPMGMFSILEPDTVSNETGTGATEINLSYSAGSVATTSGSSTVTGTNTAWLARGAHPGGLFSLAQGSYTIRSVESQTSITLTANAAATGSGLAYRIHPYGSGDTRNSGRDKFAMPGPRAMALGRARFGGTSFCQGDANQTIGAGTFALTYGSFQMTIPGVTEDRQLWLRMHDDTADESAAGPRTTSARRRQYRIVDISGNTVTIHERYRGTTGTQTLYTSGAAINDGYPALLDSSSHCLARIERQQNGTVSLAAGSTAVQGSGTSFSVGTVRVADELWPQTTAPLHSYRLAAVNSNLSLTIDAPVDGGVGTAQTATITSYRRISSSALTTQRQQRATLPSGDAFGVSVNSATTSAFFSPLFWGNGSTVSRRIQMLPMEIANPYPSLQMPSSTTTPEKLSSLLVCSGDVSTTSTTAYNIWWSCVDAMPPQVGLGFVTVLQTLGWLMPVSMVAPKARFVEFWNGRVFAADLAIYLGSSALVGGTDWYDTAPLAIQWTRPDEPMTWWNQYPTDGAGEDTISNGEGGIRAMKVLGSANALVIYRERGATLFHPTGDSINPFTKSYVATQVAPVCTEAIIEVESGHLFLATDGSIRFFNGNQLTPFPCPLERYIADNLNFTYSHWTMAVHDPVRKEYAWFIPTGTSEYLTEAIVYNYKENAWYVEDYSSRPLYSVFYCDRNESTIENRIIGCDVNRNIVAFREPSSTVPSYDFTASLAGGTATTMQWVSKELNLPIPNMDTEPRVKELKQIELQYDPAHGGVATVEVSGDGGATWTSFGTRSFTAGTAGTSTTLSGGTSGYGVKAETHMVRLTQTPNNTNDTFDMAVKGMRIYYTDMGEGHR